MKMNHAQARSVPDGDEKKAAVFFRGMSRGLPAVMIMVIIAVQCNFIARDKEGERIRLKGYWVYAKVKGEGTPTVIIENGLCCNTNLYDNLYDSIAHYTRVLSYDHSGVGRSTYNHRPRTLENYVAELKMLLHRKQISPPYILVGHSMGGFIIRYYAWKHPDEVAGLVFLDAPHEDWFSYIRSRHTPEELTFFNDYFDPEKRNLSKGLTAELVYYPVMCDSIRGKKIAPDIPVRMYTGVKYGEWAKRYGYDPDDMKMWAQMQGSILDGVMDARQFVDDRAGHMFQDERPLLVMEGIRDLIQKYRDKDTVREP